jgi:glutathione S-transferase
MKLYSFPPSPNTWKVRAVAAHLGIPLKIEFVDLTKGASRTPEFIAVNFMGRTPALVDGDFKLGESTAIMQYIAGKKPNALWPDDARARADIMRWQCWSLAHWSKDGCEPIIFERLVKQIVGMGAADETVIAKAIEAFTREAKILDGHLARQAHLVGKDITLADFSVAAPLFYADRAGIPIRSYANIGTWFGRVSALPCWRETAPQTPAAAT